MQVVGLGCTKLSVIMFYRRIFCTRTRTWFSIGTAIIGGLIVAWTISFFFVFLFYCGIQHSKEWGTVIDVVTYCSRGLHYQLGVGISDSIRDVIIIVLPVPMVWLSSHLRELLSDRLLDFEPSYRHCEEVKGRSKSRKHTGSATLRDKRVGSGAKWCYSAPVEDTKDSRVLQ